MKKHILRVALLAAVLCLLATAVFAAEGDFNAGLTISKTETSVSVTVQDSAVFETNTVKLTIPTEKDWTWAKVTFDDTELDGVEWNAADKSVTFPVAAGGTYIIEEAAAPAGNSSSLPSVPAPDRTEQPATKPMEFSDVTKGDWFYDDVKYVYENGLMAGPGNGRFDPNSTVNRAMVVQVLYNLEGKPAAGTEAFTDVTDDDWYRDAVAWAAANGIVDGLGDGRFAPLAPVTREQLATMLFRYAVFCGLDAVSLAEHLNGYADGGQVSDWAVSAMNWAVGQGLINGMDGLLNPQGSATRAQTAAILARFCRGS